MQGLKYYIPILDDFSRKRTVYFMCSRDEASNHLRSYCMSVKNARGRYLRGARCDGISDYKESSTKMGKEEVRQPLIKPGIQSVGAVVIRGCFSCF